MNNTQNSTLFVSFIIPVFNPGLYLAEAISSIRDQENFARSWEIILVDDCSTDPITLDLLITLSQQPDIRLIRQSINSGPAAARNTGIKAANGDWICFLDADDFLLPNAMELRINVILSNPSCHWIAGNILAMPEIGKITKNNDFSGIEHHGTRVSSNVIHLSRPTRYLIHSPPPQVGSTIIRKSRLTSSGLFDDTLLYGEEWYFWLNVSLDSDLFWLETPSMVLRRHHESMMKNTLDVARKMNRGSLKALFDSRFRCYRRDLRWRISSDFQWASTLFRQNNRYFASIGSAVKSLIFTPNSSRGFSILWAALINLK